MSLRLADLQVMVPKMTEIAGAQGSESARQLLAARREADSVKAMVEADTREVHTKKNAGEVTLRVNGEEDGRAGERGQGRGRGWRKDERGGDSARNTAGTGRETGGDNAGATRSGVPQGSFIDIRL